MRTRGRSEFHVLQLVIIFELALLVIIVLQHCVDLLPVQVVEVRRVPPQQVLQVLDVLPVVHPAQTAQNVRVIVVVVEPAYPPHQFLTAGHVPLVRVELVFQRHQLFVI